MGDVPKPYNKTLHNLFNEACHFDIETQPNLYAGE